MPSILYKGTTISDPDPAKIADVVKLLGGSAGDVPAFYFSASKMEWVPIGDMHTEHIRNALLLKAEAWVNKHLRSLKDPAAFVRELTDNDWLKNNTDFRNLLAELIKRAEQ